ncbi:Membrane-associated kinase regulator 4 [Quillaja saponaria]|uniref:Membrane-associated kinase regulator 4 n=1 Tax=Quillaja saponaria TaxID=32244 RepID=A0AAD7Q6T2_QUISA|nr:Membrane-associated kinase regulator 4 [Quillaja saponaria]
MAANLLACDQADDDYIDMEVSSFLYHSVSSPSHPREFEFKMTSTSKQKDDQLTTSPADELFYKGKLLPLHLPPRFEMVEELLHNSNSAYDIRRDNFEEFYSTPLATTTTPTPTSNTPFESCNISPSESCQVSRELHPDEYIFVYSSSEVKKKSWTKKLKQSSIGSKLKASRAYLKSLFNKSAGSDESFVASTKVADESSVLKANGSLNNNMKTAKKNPFGQIQKDKYSSLPSTSVRNFNKEKIITEDTSNRHRRSFSVGIKWNSSNKSSSSSSISLSDLSSSSSSNISCGFQESQFLKRCTSANSETENSIQGAIAHCKQSQSQSLSQQTFPSTTSITTASEVGPFYSLSGSRISVYEDQERPVLWRG